MEIKMNDLEIIKEIVGVAGSGGTVAILVILWKLGLFKKSNNGVPSWAEELKEHFNHETSEKLEKLQEGITGIQNTLANFDKFGIKIRKR